MAGLYNGHLLEFPRIRVDSFTAPNPHRPPWMLPNPDDLELPSIHAPNAQLYLLTHVHTDHLIGLNDNFTGRIVCSPDTKRMLLRLEAEKDRALLHNGIKEIKQRKYEGLCARRGPHGAVVDYIETLNPGETKCFDVGMEEDVSITLLDANHCPGSSMFLVTTSTKAILHTGDVRADKAFRQALRRVPQLQEFFTPSSTPSISSDPSPLRRLNRIYLDTSAFMGTGNMPEKELVLDGLLTQMCLYPPDTVFFLNVWCFGWEDVVKEVARHFGSLVHVDRYKRSIYGAVQSDPFLLRCTTMDPKATRFHACDRYNRCEQCDSRKSFAAKKPAVQVTMVEVKSAAYELHQQEFLRELNQAALGEGQWPREILVPIARHSPLPELQELVKMFQPASLSPNILIPDHKGQDYFVFADYLKPVINNAAYRTIIAERDWFFARTPKLAQSLVKIGLLRPDIPNLPPKRSRLVTAPLPWPAGANQQPLIDTRGAWAIDQLRRITGGDAGDMDLQSALLNSLGTCQPAKQTGSSPNPTPSATTRVKSEPSPTDAPSVTASSNVDEHPRPTTRSNAPASTRLKRKRQGSKFHVNISHLRDLVGSQE